MGVDMFCSDGSFFKGLQNTPTFLLNNHFVSRMLQGGGKKKKGNKAWTC